MNSVQSSGYVIGEAPGEEDDRVWLPFKITIQELLDTDVKLAELHGEVRESYGQRFLLTYYPAAGMRFPGVGEAIREDIRNLKKLLAGPADE